MPSEQPPTRVAGLTEDEVRETAVLLLATDLTLCDGMKAAEALAHVRGYYEAINDPEGPWADGKHMGDCTKQPNTCIRCQVEEAEAEARRRFDDEPAQPEQPRGEEARAEAWASGNVKLQGGRPVGKGGATNDRGAPAATFASPAPPRGEGDDLAARNRRVEE